MLNDEPRNAYVAGPDCVALGVVFRPVAPLRPHGASRPSTRIGFPPPCPASHCGEQ
jgi:hypothetical protein